MKHLSIATSFLSGNAPIDDLKTLHRAGFRYLSADFWQLSAPSKMLAQENWKDLIAAYKAAADELGILFPQTHGNTLSGMQWDDPAYAEEAEHQWMLNYRAIEASAMLGAEWMVMHPTNFPHDPLYSKKKALEANIAYLAPFIEAAKKAGVGIAIENMVDFGGKRRRYCGGDPDELIELVDTLNDPDVGICIDTGHAHLSGIDVGAFIRTVGARLKCTHIDDNRRDGDTHMPPYFGTIDWADVMRAFDDIGYKGDFSFELSGQRFPESTRDTWCRFIHDLGTDMMAKKSL